MNLQDPNLIIVVVASLIITLLLFAAESYFQARRRGMQLDGDTGGQRILDERQRNTMQAVPAIAAPVAAAPPPATVPPSADPAVLSLAAWMSRVNGEPDRSPHLIIAGPSGSGKTTLALAVLQLRPGRVFVTTMKRQREDPWGGLPVVRLGTSEPVFAPLGEAIREVYAEVLRRNQGDADVSDDWLTLVIDEYPTIAAEHKGVSDVVLRMLRIARSVRVRLILISTETGVKALGLEGNGDARQNCLFVELNEDRAARMFRWGKPPVPIDTHGVGAIAAAPFAPHRAWLPPSTAISVTPEADTAAEKAPEVDTPFSAALRDFTVSGRVFTLSEVVTIAAEIARGEKRKTEIVKLMPGYAGRKHAAYAAFYDRIAESLAVPTEPQHMDEIVESDELVPA